MASPTGLQIYKTSRNAYALARVCGELVNVAAGVIAEADTVPKHAERLAFANAIFQNGPDGHAARMMPKLLSLPGAQAKIAEINAEPGMVDEAALGTAIQTALAAIFNDFAVLIR